MTGKMTQCTSSLWRRRITEKHISQLSQYMGMLVNGRHVGGCTVGMLIDHSTVRLAFSPLATNDRQWPLPIIFVSSALQWRVGIRLNECVCIAMSLFNNFRHERSIANESEWRLFLGGKAWAETNKVAQEAVKSGYILSRPGEMPSWYEEI